MSAQMSAQENELIQPYAELQKKEHKNFKRIPAEAINA